MSPKYCHKEHSLSVLPLIDNREDAEWSATCGTVLYEFLAIRIDAQTVVIEIVLTLATVARHYTVRREGELVVKHIGLVIAVGTLRVEDIENGRRREIAIAHNDTGFVI